ncbi:MAG: HEAT repeat domain-containing protein, partial [Nitrolancea sp.]
MDMAPSNALLLRFFIAEMFALVLVGAIVFGHAFWLRWCARRDSPLLAAARAGLIDALDSESQGDGTLDAELQRTFRRLPGQQQINLFSSLASSLGGGQRASLTRFAVVLGLVKRGERLCRSRFWWRRLHGCRMMTLIGAGEDVVPALFQDRHPEVRAQAAEWTTSHPTPENVAALVTQLASSSTLCRFSVQDSLLRLGTAAIEPLTTFLATHDGTEVQAALEVAVGLADPGFLASALRLCRDPEAGVRTLATALIGALGGDASLPVLLELL